MEEDIKSDTQRAVKIMIIILGNGIEINLRKRGIWYIGMVISIMEVGIRD